MEIIQQKPIKEFGCLYCHLLPYVKFGELREMSENNTTVNIGVDELWHTICNWDSYRNPWPTN